MNLLGDCDLLNPPRDYVIPIGSTLNEKAKTICPPVGLLCSIQNGDEGDPHHIFI